MDLIRQGGCRFMCLFSLNGRKTYVSHIDSHIEKRMVNQVKGNALRVIQRINIVTSRCGVRHRVPLLRTCQRNNKA